MSRYRMGLQAVMGFDVTNVDTLQKSFQAMADLLARMRDAGVVLEADENDLWFAGNHLAFEHSDFMTDDPAVAKEFQFYDLEGDEDYQLPQEPDTEANTLPLLKHKDWEVRNQGCKILAEVGSRSSLSELRSVLYGAKLVAKEAENAIKVIKERAWQPAAPVVPPVTVENEDVENEDVDEIEDEYVEDDDYLNDDDFYGSVDDDSRLRPPADMPPAPVQVLEQRAE